MLKRKEELIAKPSAEEIAMYGNKWSRTLMFLTAIAIVLLAGVFHAYTFSVYLN